MHKQKDALSILISATGPFWSGRNLRRFLSVLIPFALVCVLTFKVLSGRWFSFSPASFAAWPLGGSFLFPVSVFQLPIQVIILGLLLGLIVIVTVLSAQSFGLAPAVFFVASVFWLGHLPMMALVLLVAAFLAGNPTLLSRSRFYSALLGLVPVTVYLFLAVWIVLTKTDPTYVYARPPANSLWVGIVACAVCPTAVYFVLPVFMLMGFIAGLPVMLWRRRSYLYWLVLIIIAGYMVTSVLVYLQTDGYAFKLTLRSLAESIWPEISSAGQASRQDFASLSPVQQSWLYAPALLAICSALALLPILLWVSRWRGKPATVLGLTTLLIGSAGLILFYTAVGSETLEYVILKGRFEPNSSLLRDFSGIEEHRICLEQYQLATDPFLQLQLEQKRAELSDLLDHTYRTSHKTRLKTQILQIENELRLARQQGRSDAVDRKKDVLFNWIISQFENSVTTAETSCQRFLNTYPRSRYRSHVMYIRASVLDARIDYLALKRDGSVYVYYRFPSPQSKTTWQALLQQYPKDVLACPAGLALGRLLAREGSFTAAMAVLDRSYNTGRSFLDRPSAVRLGGFFATQFGLPPTQPILPEQVSVSLGQIQQLTELINSNYADPIYGSEPLRRFLTRDPQAAGYVKEIEDIRNEFPDALIADNIWVQIILTQLPDERLGLLRSAVDEFVGQDAGRDALFYLAQLEMSLAGEDPANEHLRSHATKHFNQFEELYPESYRTTLVKEQLARLSLLAAPVQ